MAKEQSKRHRVTFILLVVLIDVIGLGIIIPVSPQLIVDLTGKSLSEAAVYGGYLAFLYSAMQFVFAPVLGNLSDRFGRRPVLLLSLLVFGIDYIIMGLAPTILWLFIGRALAGIAGASGTAASAYMADISAPEDRAKNFGLIGAAWGLGFIIGPAIGGALGQIDTRLPFFVAGGLAFANLAYGYFLVPESLPPEKRRPFSLWRANPVGTFFHMSRYPVVIGLCFVLFLYQIAHDAAPTTWTFYTMLKFDWTSLELGISLAILGIMIIVVQGWLIRIVIDRIGEIRTAYTGYVITAVAAVGLAMAPNTLMFYVWILPWSMMGLVGPALRGILSNQVPDDAQGELQGAITAVISLTAIMSPIFMTQLFRAFTADDAPVYFPGAPFFAAGIMLLASMTLFAIVVRITNMQSVSASKG